MLYVPLLVSTLFSVLGYVHAQFNDSVSIVTPLTADTGDLFLVACLWTGVFTHEPKNASFELMVGKAEDNGNEVADIMEINSAGITSFWYRVHAATPPGDYHIRMNATIFQKGVPIGPFTQRSQRLPIVQAKPFACTVPAWEPVRSVSDPGFGSLRVDLPNGGDVYYLSDATHNLSSIGYSISIVDANFQREDASITLELVNTRTGASAGVQKITGGELAFQSLEMDNFNVTAGPWKVRATSSVPGSANFSVFSDEFYISSQAPCGGLAPGKSTTSGGSDGSPSGAPTSIGFSAFLLGMVPVIAVSVMTL
ncbi:hypothetical protein C8J57DRAFT_1391747 [Mycena rebaudengoi]|nr:hypothetical protein C8J57DRAFT_1391747 [Mycena rebaudengoi]